MSEEAVLAIVAAILLHAGISNEGGSELGIAAAFAGLIGLIAALVWMVVW